MSSSSSLYLRQLIVALTWFGLLALACTGGSSHEEGRDEESEFRGGDPPAGLDVAVDTLRGNGITIAASIPVGTISSGGSVSATGQAGYTVPLELPPGAGGLAPSLSLAYSSGAGNGLFGIGWGLTGFSSIDRCGKTIADDGAFSPVELDGDDALCFGGQRLVLVAGTHLQPGAEYRTKRDPFSRITTRSYQGALVYFDVESPDGLISTYGYTEALSSGGIRYSWLLETIRDRYANTVAYDYVADGGSPSLRPSSVSWNGGRVTLVADPAGRDDERRGFRFGIPYAQLDRIAAIEVYGADDALLHTYELDYEYVAQWAFGEQAPEPWAAHTRSTLQRVSKCDAAGVCMPPTTFQYSGSGTALDVPSENLPGMPEGVEHLSQEQQDVLRWGKKSLAGDFNGDLDYELIVWDPQAEAFEVVAPGSTIGVADVAGLDPPSVLPPSWEDVAYWLEAGIRSIAQDPYAHELQASEVGPLHRVQPTMGYLVVNFDNDRRDDILYAVGGGHDLDDVGYADSLRIATQGSDYEDPENDDTLSFSTVNVDDFSAERIYNVVPLDHDGNGLTDLWLCRGNGGFKSARWVLALNEGDSGTFGFSFHDSNVGCSIHDELNVVSLRGARQSLLVIPAYEWDPDEILERDDVGDYVGGVLPLDETLRLFYLELQFEPGSAEDGELVDSGLPRDLFQRWRDRDCQNSLADADIGLPLFSVGLSRDRHVDLNGDGYVDILRAELANDPVGFPGGSDTQHNITAIKTGFGPSVGYGLGVTCDAIPSQPLVLRGWINTGTGFVRGDRFYTFPGNPHANYWVNIQGGQLSDRDRDGYADLLVPGTGASNNWTYLMGSGQAIGCPGGTCATTTSVGLPSGWPSYSTAIASNLLWRNSVERASLLQLRAIGGIAFEGAVDDEPDPIRAIEILPYETYHNNGLRLWRVTSGLGYFAAGAFGAASEEFYYGCAGLPSLVTESGVPGQANRPKTTPRACVPVVTRHFVRVRGEEPGDGAYTDYDYSGAVIDQHGRGFVGFEQVQSQYSNDYFTYDTTLSDYDLTYNATLRDYPYAGIAVRTRVTRHFGTTGQMLDVRCSDRDVGEWDVVTIPRIGGLTWFSYPTETRTYGQAVSSSSSENGCDDLTPDQETFATEQRNPDGTVTLVGSSTTDGEQLTMTPSNFVNDATNWFIGKPQRIDVESCVDGVCRTRSTALSYQPLTHALTGITREPDQVGTPLFLHTQFHYGVAGRLHDVFVNDAFGETRQTTIDWDSDGRLPLLVINPEGHTTYLVHDESSGVQWATVAPDGITTITEFDGFYRPVEQRVHDMPLGPSDGRLEIDYIAGAEPSFGAPDAVMRVRTSQYPYGQRVTAEIDAAGREVRRRWKAAPDTTTFPIPLPTQTSFQGGDVYVDTRYDEFGRANRTSHPTKIGDTPLHWTHVNRDVFGRPIRQFIADDWEPPLTETVVETWNYTHGGGIDGHDVSLEAQHTDADGRTTTSFIDLNGRVAVTRDALNTLTCFDYAPFGVLESVQRNCASGASGPSTTTTYVPDAIGRIVGENDPAFGKATTSYTAFGEVDVTVDAAGIAIDMDYDKLGRPIARDENGQGTATWDWDTNRLGQLYESVSVDGFTRRYVYGPFRRLQERRTVGPTTPGGTAPKRASELFGYSSGGRLTRIEFDAEGKDPNFAIKLEYDEFLNLRSVRKDAPGPLYWGSRKISLAGQVTHEQRGLTDPSIPTTAVFTTNTYAAATLRLEKIETTKSGAINPLQSLAYTWTPGGDLQQRTDTAPVAPNPDQVENLGHDALHRLTSWQIAGGSTRTVTYDVLGNITFKSDTGTYTYDAQRRLDTTSVGAVSYDFLADGNLSTWGGKTLTWTPLDQVRTLTTPTGSFSYRYDAEGTRTSRSDGTNVNVRISELFERRYASNGWPTVYYRIPTGDGRIAAEVKFTPTICAGDSCSWNETTRFVHDDHLGSSSLLTNTAGNAVGGVNYDPWGRPRNRTSWKDYLADSSTADIATGFTGHQPEMEGGLINMRGRMYDPRVGRFASVDPIVQAPLSSQGWTPYSYVFNQPLSMVDPSGYEGLGGGNNSCDNAPRGHMCTPYVVPTERPTLRPATEGQLYASVFGPGIGGFNGIGLGGGGAFGFSGISSSGVPGPSSGSNIVSAGGEQDSIRPGLTGWTVGGSLGLGMADWVGDYAGPGLSARIRVPRTLRPGAKRRGVSVTKTPDGYARVYEDETVNPLVHLQKSPGIRAWGKRTGRQWGHPAVIDAIANVGRTWNKVHPNNPIRIGDISLQEGGQFEPHVSHDQGLDVDVAIMTTTPSVLKRHVGNSTYSRDLTRELVQTFLNEKTLKIAMIFFSDEVLAEEFDVIIDDGIHWSHFHIRYKQ